MVSQQDLGRMIAKHVLYVIQVRPLLETIRNNIYIIMKMTSQEKARVSVCPAAKADETQLKPM